MATRLNSADLSPVIVPGIGNSQNLIASTRRQVEEVSALGHAFLGLLSMLWRPLNRLQAIINQAHAMRDLAAMDDRMLADIGIRREQIPLIAAGREAGSNVDKAVNRYLSSL